MKLKVLFASVLSSALLLTSCSDAWLEEVKIDQNRPADVPMNVLLPSAQASYGMMQGDVLPRLTSIFMQQMTGMTANLWRTTATPKLAKVTSTTHGDWRILVECMISN